LVASSDATDRTARAAADRGHAHHHCERPLRVPYRSARHCKEEDQWASAETAAYIIEPPRLANKVLIVSWPLSIFSDKGLPCSYCLFFGA
jgi:hypothetical protein